MKPAIKASSPGNGGRLGYFSGLRSGAVIKFSFSLGVDEDGAETVLCSRGSFFIPFASGFWESGFCEGFPESLESECWESVDTLLNARLTRGSAW